MASTFQPIESRTFGGGLNLQAHPAELRPDEWAFCNGFMPLDGAAEQWPSFSTLGSTLGVGGDIPLGLVNDSFLDTSCLVGLDRSAKLVLVSVDLNTGTPTTITRAGGAADPDSNDRDVFSTAFLNGFQVMSCGLVGVALGKSSLIRYSGGATYDRIDPPGGESLTPGDIVSFGGHIIAAPIIRTSTVLTSETRRVAWSSANNESLWLPALDNDADDVLLDDASSSITGLARLGNDAVALLTRDTVFGLIPTGRIPAFTRQVLIPGVGGTTSQASVSANERRQALYGEVPGGAVVIGGDQAYYLRGGQPVPIGMPIVDYLTEPYKTSAFTIRNLLRPIIYHQAWRQIIIPRFAENANGEVLTYSPADQAWGRIQLGDVVTGTDVPARHRVLYTDRGPRWFLLTNTRQLWKENNPISGGGGFPNAFVETKDFAIPGRLSHCDEALLYWEDLTGSSTVEVAIASRNDMASGTGTVGRRIAPTFTTLGTLSASATRFPVRRHARFHRLKFTVTAGRVRIRGLSVALRIGGQSR